jgi:hypothetical protein
MTSTGFAANKNNKQSKANAPIGDVFKNANPMAAWGFPTDASSESVEETIRETPIGNTKVDDKDLKLIHTTGQYYVTSTYGAETENLTFTSPSDLRFPPDDSRFAMVNTDYWINQSIERIIGLKFLSGKEMNIEVDAECEEMDNAHFSPVDNKICLGYLFGGPEKRKYMKGMAGAAWDGDVVVHEFGHGVFHHLNTMPKIDSRLYFSSGNDLQGAMDEGQADFQAYGITANKKMASWFMYTITEGKENVLRVIDNDFNIQKNVFREVHADGRIFAGALYDLSRAIGAEETLRLWLSAVPKIQEVDNFYQYAKYMIESDQNLNGGKNESAIRAAFTGRGIIGNAPVTKSSVQVLVKVVDDPEIVAAIAKLFKFPKNFPVPNGDGELDPGECVFVELGLKNVSGKDLVGLEIFVPNGMLPQGVRNVAATRTYLGNLKTGASFPQTADITNRRRPYLFVCADKTFRKGDEMRVMVSAVADGNPIAYSVALETNTEMNVKLPRVSPISMFRLGAL